MRAAESEIMLRKRLGQPLAQLTASDGIAAMCSFYADERTDGAAIGSDRDMLLYQWGVDTFNAPETFRVSITRQLNVIGESQPYQLTLIFSFQPTDSLRKIDSGNQWCRSPADLPTFQRFVDASEPFKSIAHTKADQVELQLNRRG